MIAIKRKNGTVIWLDAVMSFTEDYNSTVTKHKVGKGSTISDHTIEENATFTLDGVVSGVEWNNGPTYGLSTLDAVTDLGEVPQTTIESIEALQSVNLPANVSHVSIIQGLQNPIIKLLPESLRQFIDQSNTPPEVLMGEASAPDNLESIKSTLILLNRGFPKTMNGKVINIKEEVTILRFDYDWSPLSPILDCICTGLSFSEDPDSGDAIYPKMKFEKVRYAGIEQTTVPSFMIKNKGKQQGVEATADLKADPTKEETTFDPLPKQARSAAAGLAGMTGGGTEADVYQAGYNKPIAAGIKIAADNISGAK